MLVQMSEATLTLLLTMLAVGAVIRFMPAADGDAAESWRA